MVRGKDISKRLRDARPLAACARAHETEFTVSRFKNTGRARRRSKTRSIGRGAGRGRRPAGRARERARGTRAVEEKEQQRRCFGRDPGRSAAQGGAARKEKEEGKKQRTGKTRNHRRRGVAGEGRGEKPWIAGGGETTSSGAQRGRRKTSPRRWERKRHGLYNETRLGGHRLVGGSRIAGTGIRP